MGKLDVEIALEDAEQFLKLAKSGEKENLKNRVIASAYIHALIRANDSLCHKYLGEVPKNHQKSSKYFQKLYEHNHIGEKYSKYTSNIKDVLSYKNDVEYKGISLSEKQFSKLKKQVKRFIEKPVKQNIEIDG